MKWDCPWYKPNRPRVHRLRDLSCSIVRMAIKPGSPENQRCRWSWRDIYLWNWYLPEILCSKNCVLDIYPKKKTIQLFMMLAHISKKTTQQVYEILLVEWLHKNLQMCLAESFSNNSPVVTAWLSVTHLTGSRPGWRTALQSSWDFLPGHAPIWWLEMAELLYESWNFIKKNTTHPM